MEVEGEEGGKEERGREREEEEEEGEEMEEGKKLKEETCKGDMEGIGKKNRKRIWYFIVCRHEILEEQNK